MVSTAHKLASVRVRWQMLVGDESGRRRCWWEIARWEIAVGACDLAFAFGVHLNSSEGSG